MESEPPKSQGPNWAETAEGDIVPRYDEAPNQPVFSRGRSYPKGRQLEDMHPEFAATDEPEPAPEPAPDPEPEPAPAPEPTRENPSREHGQNNPYDQPPTASEKAAMQDELTEEERRRGLAAIEQIREEPNRRQQEDDNDLTDDVQDYEQ